MKNKKMYLFKNAFTLIELITVIVVIGILAALALPKYNALIEKSRQAEAYTMLAHIRGAEERYKTEKGTYTLIIGDLDIDAPTGVFFNYGIQSVIATTFSATAKRSSGSYSSCVISVIESGAISKNASCAQ